MNTDIHVITTSNELATFCESLAVDQHIAVDTEFIREKTYYSQLCLIQVAGNTNAAIIDPLAKGIDLTPLYDLFANTRIMKVFHAGKQDLEIFATQANLIPTPFFDTQIAAEFCGYGESISYSELMRRLLDVRIDKASRFTDWAKRPLSKRQLEYALSDVTHLHKAYGKLVADLKKSDRLEWAENEMQPLTRLEDYLPNPQAAWKRLKIGNMKPRSLAALQRLAEWREETAMRKDLPRPRVVKDEVLLEIAASLPADKEHLNHIRSIRQLNEAQQKQVLEMIQEVQQLDKADLPSLPKRKSDPRLSSDCLHMLQMLLGIQCRRHRLTPRLLANRTQLEQFVADPEDSALMHGWRYEIFGRDALDLLNGKLFLGYDAKDRQAVLKRTDS